MNFDKYRSERDEDGCSTGKANHGFIAIKKGLDYNDFISRIDISHDCTKQGFICSSCYKYLFQWINCSTNVLAVEF